MQTVRIPECRLARVMTEIVMQILGLRVKFGKRKGILLQKMDAKSAFRQGGCYPGPGSGVRVSVGGSHIHRLRSLSITKAMGGGGW